MLPSLILLICLLTGTQQSHVDLICPAAPGPFDPVMCSKITIVSNCLTDADCTGEHQKCCLRECNVLQCITFSFEPGVGEPGPGDPAPAPVPPPPPQDGSQTTPACPLLDCRNSGCQFGFETDRNGCDTCICKNTCPLLDCRNSGCQFGFETDRNGCDTCICKNSPCPQYGPPPPGYCSRPGEIFIKDGVKCNRPPILFPCNGGNPHKPGKCPAVNLAALTCLAGELPRKCNTDLSCPGIQKCCRRLCEFVCLNPTPVSKPGKCPFVNLALVDCFAGPLHRECNDDGSCPGTQKCCRRGCAFVCRDPGNPCPPEPVCPTSPISPGHCEPRCKFDYETLNGVKCKIRCTRGPRGPPPGPGQPCSPTGCPLFGPPSDPRPIEPAPVPPPPRMNKPGECPYFNPATTSCFVPKNAPGTPLCGNDGDCPGKKKCCRACRVGCLNPGNPCPPEPVCPTSPISPGQCEPRCKFDYETLNGVRCKIRCTRGPRGPPPVPGQPCPPTGCPLFGPPSDPRPTEPEPPAPAPPPPPVDKPGECPYFNPASTSCTPTRPPLCGNDGDCPGKKKCCKACGIGCLDPGNPCPREPVCPPAAVMPGQCEPMCVFEYETTVNGVRCKVRCTRGPRGPPPGPGQPCPPTGCPLIGPPTDPGSRPPAPAPAPVPPSTECPPVCAIFCPYGYVLDKNNCPICECKTECPPVCAIFCPFGNVLDKNNCPMCECKTGNPHKPGKCPAVDLASITCPVGETPRKCKNDLSCPGLQKCCRQICEFVCVDPNPVTKPGECPVVNLTAITCPDGPLPRHCIDDGSCPMDQKCCRRRCATVCTYPVTVDKPGECPYVNLAAILCPANSFPTKCLNDGSCPGNQKCCNQGCSINCTDPGNPCPPEPVCPSSSVGPRDCEPRCIFEYVTSTNGVRCKVGCTRGPLGPRPGPDHPCPPTGCPLNGPSTDPGEPGPPSPAPGPQPKHCAKCCGPPPCCSFCIDCEIGNPLTNHYCGSIDKVCPKGYYCKTNPEIGRLGVCCKGTRPNKCPADKFKNTKCNEKSKIRLCKTDDNCSPNKKCCKQGCFYYCIDPEWYEWYKW